MAQALISTASGVAMALGSLPPPLSFVMAGIVGALGAAQLAIIAGTNYQSTSSSASSASAMPSSLTIGRRNDSIDLGKGANPNAGGEIGYLRGSKGIGSNGSNFTTIGSAYGGRLGRGYGNTAFALGEKGPEIMTAETPMNDNKVSGGNTNANISISAIDAKGVEDVLYSQRGNIISMLREAANASGDRFLENIDVNVYTKPNVSRL